MDPEEVVNTAFKRKRQAEQLFVGEIREWSSIAKSDIPRNLAAFA